MLRPLFYVDVPIKNIHDYLWFKIVDFKCYPVHYEDLRNMIKIYMRSIYL